MLTNIYVLTQVQDETLGFALMLEGLLAQAVLFLEIFLEIIAILIIAFSALITLQRLLKFGSRVGTSATGEVIRLKFGLSLALALEFLLAADIVATAISPSWDIIGKLAAVTGVRTFLNFFLQREVQELEAKTKQIDPRLELEEAKKLTYSRTRDAQF